MDWVQEHCDRLRSKLQGVVDSGASSGAGELGLRVPWSWTCRTLIETVRRYPSGLTEAVILAELELLCEGGGTFEAPSCPESFRPISMRSTPRCPTSSRRASFATLTNWCRLLTGAAAAVTGGGGRAGGGEGGRRSPNGGGPSTLLLTEYLAFVLDHRRSDDLRLAQGMFGGLRVKDTFEEKSNYEEFFVVCKGDGLGVYWPWLVREQQPRSSGGDQGSAAAPGGLSSQQQLVSSQLPLPSDSFGWHFEYGSATALFVLPRESRAQLFSAANNDSNGDGFSTGGPGVESRSSGGGGGGSGNSGGGVVVSRKATSRGAGVDGRGRGGTVGAAHEMPADENGVRDLLQFPRRLFVTDLAPNMSNASIYGQVVSVASVPGSSLPAILPPSRGMSSSSSSLSQLPLKPVMLMQQQQQQQEEEEAGMGLVAARGAAAAAAANVVELLIRDDRGTARVLCCGRKAAADALRCRPGQYVLVCGLRTFAAAFPPLDDSEQGPDGHVVVLCGEAEEMSREDAAATTDAEGRAAAGARSGGAGGGGDSVSGVLNTSSLEGFLHCPFLSRHSFLHDRRRTPGPRASLACKAAVTWARWTFDGDGLWAVHRRCGARLPCHFSALGASADPARRISRKRPRDMREPGCVRSGRTGAQQGVSVICPLCQSSVRVACADEAELGYAPLLLALDDGTRCLVAECRSAVVTAAFGGMNAHDFLQMGEAERKATVDSLVGREIRCVVGGDGAASEVGGNGSACFNGGGGEGDWNGAGRVGLRVERIASVNPAADLAYLVAAMDGSPSKA
ncbi:hypothetical protein Esi_0002_0212 [Ectocarpus siliculosus]|uniref:Cell division control protein 24 OB domain-containing protein n=1 Tax=Ectocarpus siliculosus TaxID=2880 RepID=D7FQ83_ECTSI|nr:hypothetical protein Esi_0002_0212 [Ectocarpus siliculosus]|eukprot:CBJ48415.1 hypothetical protein Esi_0002_0212 [Ectocarpus siliculosus]